MRTLQVQDVSLAFGDREILRNIGFTMSEKTRAALAGANGSGKSTLLKVISGRMPADSSSIAMTRGCRISYLPQSDIVLPDITVYEAAEEGFARFDGILQEIQELGDQASAGSMQAAERLAECHDMLLESGYYDRRSRIETILLGLGFRMADLQRKTGTFSGGYQMRIALARILIENPDFLFLDEPTNYLDIEALVWLEEYLRSFDGGLMVVSHDQGFLDDLVSEVYELFNGRLSRYQGNYTAYTIRREEEIRELEKQARKQQEEIERTEVFIERFRYKATKSKQVQSRIKALDRMELVEIPAHLRKLSFTFPPSPHSGNDVLKVEHLRKAYGDNVIYDGFSFLVKKGERLAITGRNGAGKSTLLRMIAGTDSDYSGTIQDGAGVKKAYFAQDGMGFGHCKRERARVRGVAGVYGKLYFAAECDVVGLPAEHDEEVHARAFFWLCAERQAAVRVFVAGENLEDLARFGGAHVAVVAVRNSGVFDVVGYAEYGGIVDFGGAFLLLRLVA